MKLNFIEKFLGSGFYTGYISIASGTFASTAALLIYWIPGFENIYIIAPAIMIFAIWGIFIGNKFDVIYGKDPSECTIDEVVGMWISLIMLPKTIIVSIIAFFVWRLFDIIKPYPARKLESLKGGLGIMADDVMSSIYSWIVVFIIVKLFNLG